MYKVEERILPIILHCVNDSSFLVIFTRNSSNLVKFSSNLELCAVRAICSRGQSYFDSENLESVHAKFSEISTLARRTLSESRSQTRILQTLSKNLSFARADGSFLQLRAKLHLSISAVRAACCSSMASKEHTHQPVRIHHALHPLLFV